MQSVTMMTKPLRICHGATIWRHEASPGVRVVHCRAALRASDDRGVRRLLSSKADGATRADRSPQW